MYLYLPSWSDGVVRKRKRKAKPAPPRVGDPSDPHGLGRLAESYLTWMRVKNFSEHTIGNRLFDLRDFTAWCAERSVTRPGEVTKPILERYQRSLYHHRKKNGQPLSFQTQYARLMSLRVFFRWLTRQSHILYNPAAELELPKLEHRLPKEVLTAKEVEVVLAQPDVETALGLRDRAILETLYSTGMRRMELVGLSLYSIETERGTVMIRQGKGKKDRVVPIGARALSWVQRYVESSRPALVSGQDEGALFLTSQGEAFTPAYLSELVREYVTSAKLDKSGSCHLFRHSMATLMLEGGADIRYVQAMLGHARLDTTQIYTQVSIRKLKEVHESTHPGRDGGGRESVAGGEDALLVALAAETAEEESDGV